MNAYQQRPKKQMISAATRVPGNNPFTHPTDSRQRACHRYLQLGFTLALVLTILMSGCSPKGERFENGPIILISVDTLRADHLPTYGYDVIETPHLSAFAADSVVFEHAYAQVPLTLPSHATMFTGNLPHEHGIRDNLGFALSEKEETLAERLKQAGYRTGGSVSSMVLRHTTGIAQGFDSYDDHFNLKSLSGISNYSERLGGDSLAKAEEWMAGVADKPFFLFLHLYDPHTPYAAPEPFKGQAKHPYDDEILYVDHLLGGFFERLKQQGIYDRAIILLVSDHGEGLGEHGEQQHGLLLYRPMIEVPFIVKLPGQVRSGERRSDVVGLMDVAPTLSQLTTGDTLGNSGQALFSGAEPDPDRVVLSESLNPYLSFGWRALKSGVYKRQHYIESSEPLLFDMAVDPGELNNLFGQQKLPNALQRALPEIPLDSGNQVTISKEEMDLLASLGYSGSFAVDDAARDLDEAEFMKLYNLIGQCKMRLDQGAFAEVEKLLIPVVERFPGMIDARLFLGNALASQGKGAQAEYVYTEALALAPRNLSIMVALCGAKLNLKKQDEAMTLVNRSVEMAPRLGPRLLLPVLYRHSLYAKGGELAKRLLKDEPNYAFAKVVLAAAATAGQRFDQASSHLQEAIRLNEASPDTKVTALIHYHLGDLAARNEDFNGAVTAFNRALETDPNLERARTGLSFLYFATGQVKRGLDNLNAWIEVFPTTFNLRRAAEVCRAVGLDQEAQSFSKRIPKEASEGP